MSTSTVPKEQLTAYQRWEMASFEEEQSRPHPLREPPPPAASQQSINAILQQVRQAAYEEGLQHGYRDGMAQADQQLAGERQQLLQVSGQFQQALQMADTRVAESVLTVALELAKAMLKTTLQVQPQAIIPVVLDAIHYLPQVKQPARLIVHHDDARLLRQHLGEALSAQGWQVVEEANIERGGCLVETADNQIDATNAMRWKRLTQGLSRVDDWYQPVMPTLDADTVAHPPASL